MNPLYLASGSPRRRELLTQIGVPFTAISADIDETPLPNEAPAAYVERLARGKAEAGRGLITSSESQAPACVLGADTAVVLDGRILGKPVDADDACAMLAALSGRDDMTVSAYGRDGRVILVSLFDNLGKGASGAAVQNLNLVLGLDEASGLD